MSQPVWVKSTVEALSEFLCRRVSLLETLWKLQVFYKSPTSRFDVESLEMV